ncbi:hypothetical protein [Rhizobium laguerreae]|uniref:hypothetical protein n=1 Tax=Rhizobium laguerreae TaxID=1076926 RepID=UPI001C92A32E|nr:hypothetical protein [Rhizobium laguerreae]MBY3124549.1 hypothetical protein [Rhizobium laguerreae]
MVIVEINTDLLPDRARLQADEDAAWFIWRSGEMADRFHPPSGMTEKHEQGMHFSTLLENLSECGLGHGRSLALLGNCSHKGSIPPSAITGMLRYSVADGPWWLAFHDPSISPMNYRFNGAEYRATQLVVAGRLDEARQVEQLFPGFLDLDVVEEICALRRTEIPLPPSNMHSSGEGAGRAA